jgi:sarcosine oxidase, subunit beta
MKLVAAADVVIIGGGVVGASTAWHLTELGVSSVVLLERDVLGAGSTSKSAGGIRMQFADAINVQIMQRSVPAFERFAEQVGADIGLQQPGYLFLVTHADGPRFEEALAIQHALGVRTERLTVEQALLRVPQIEPEGLAFATYNPRDGYATPEAVVQGYVTAAHTRGARVHQGCAVTDIVVGDGRVQSVVTSKGTIGTSVVVCAAGVDSGAIGRMVGLDIPVRGERHWLHYSPHDCGLPADVPLTIDFATGFYIHREGTGLLLGGREQQLDELAERATARIPALEALGIQSSWYGDYEMSPDRNAIVGRAEEPAGFYYATGFSGHGFQQAPAIGEHLAELIVGRPPSLELASLSVERFARGAIRGEAFVV